MYKKLLTGAISVLICSHAMAEDYQFVANLDYLNSQIDPSKYNGKTETEMNTLQLSGTYYFAPVKTAGHPLAEAAFLERNSSLSLAYAQGKDEESWSFYDEFYNVSYKRTATDKTAQFFVGGETYVFDNFLYIAGYIDDAATKTTVTERITVYDFPEENEKFSSKYKDSDNLVHMNLGLAPLPGLLIWSEFDENSDDYSGRNINAKYVMEFGGSALNIQGGFGKNSATNLFVTTLTPDAIRVNFRSIDYDLTSAYVVSDFYFTDSLSLGLGASHIDLDKVRSADDFDDVYMIRGQIFIADQVSINVKLLKDDAEESLQLGASLRF